MKTLFGLLLAVFLVGCSNKKDSMGKTAEMPSTTQTQDRAPPPPVIDPNLKPPPR